MKLQGTVALITGGARGQGAAEARLFAEEGAQIVLADLLVAEGNALADEISANGGEAMFVKLDVGMENEWMNAVEQTLKRFGKLNILINNAGILQRNRIEDTSAEEWDKVMLINAKGVFLGTKHVIPAMRRAGGGAIVNISSTAAFLGMPRGSAYAASKSAVSQITKSTAIQHAKDGVRANAILPGAVDTDMLVARTVEARTDAASKIPLARLGTVEDIARAALFLVSEDSAYITGADLVVDGGLSVQ
jgi:NAD(P)-dependent dehydrogenase (short-subunit alcohol dehydrogenase family)